MIADIYTGIMQGHENTGCRLETISFLTIGKRTGSRWRAMCSVCMIDKDSKKNSVNSAIVQNVCARTALSDSSSYKEQ